MPLLADTPRDTPDLPPGDSVRGRPSGPPPSSKPLSAVPTHAPANVAKRLQSELMQLMMSKNKSISAFPTDSSNLLHWTATIQGTSDTPYANLSFKLTFSFPSNYPFAPPEVLFTTPIYHPNIDFSGRICLDILKDKWSAVMNVQAVLLSLQQLLGDPNCSSPLNAEAAGLWERGEKEVFQKKVLDRHNTA